MDQSRDMKRVQSASVNDIDMKQFPITATEKRDNTMHYVPLKSKAFIELFIFEIFWMCSWIMGIAIPLLGAQWAGDCINQSGFSLNMNLNITDDCDPDYVTYNFYFTLFQSIGGAISFLFASFLGRLSDSFGRRIFLCFAVLSWFIPRVTLTLHLDFFLYWTLILLSDFNGQDQIIPALKASVSDIIAPDQRVRAFGNLHGAMGGGVILGALIAITISSTFNSYTVLFATCIWYLVLLIYIGVFIKETIDINGNRISITSNVWKNPLKPLTVICSNRFICILCLLNLCASLIEAGVMSSLFGYVGHSLQLNEDGKASVVFGVYTVIVSLSLVPTSTLFLPFLKRNKVHYSRMITISVSIRIISLLLLAAVSLCNPYFGESAVYVLYASAVFHGSGMFSFAVIDGTISEYVTKDCQGIAFGVVTSYRGISSAVGPFAFGMLFTKLSDTSFSAVFILVGIVLAMVMIVLAVGPLKKILDSTKSQTIQVRMNEETDSNEKEDALVEDRDEVGGIGGCNHDQTPLMEEPSEFDEAIKI